MRVLRCDLDRGMDQNRFLSTAMFAVFATVSGCAEVDQLISSARGDDVNSTVQSQQPRTGESLPRGTATTPEALDQSTEAERKKAKQVSAAGQNLGQTVASLGSPSEAGFWLKTPLVKVETPGQIRDRATGNALAVRLIPINGPVTAGSRMSLAAMRALNVGLSELVTVDVYR